MRKILRANRKGLPFRLHRKLVGSGWNLPTLRPGEAFFIFLAADSRSARRPPDAKPRVIWRSRRMRVCSFRIIALPPSIRFRRRSMTRCVPINSSSITPNLPKQSYQAIPLAEVSPCPLSLPYAIVICRCAPASPRFRPGPISPAVATA